MKVICLTDTVYASNNHLNQSAVISKKYQFDQKIVVEVFVHLLQIQHVRVKSDDNGARKIHRIDYKSAKS